MDLITSICAGIAAFVGSVLAHFVAHDAYTASPSYARRLIERAVRDIPLPERDRYREEWLADLEDHHGVFTKLKHAIECLLCASKVAKLCSARPRFEVQVDGVSHATVSGVAGLMFFEVLDDLRENTSLGGNERLILDFLKKYPSAGLPAPGEIATIAAVFEKAASNGAKKGKLDVRTEGRKVIVGISTLKAPVDAPSSKVIQ